MKIADARQCSSKAPSASGSGTYACVFVRCAAMSRDMRKPRPHGRGFRMAVHRMR
ncbi:putative lipoprotein [Slackia sp. CM382]|uniref:Lipoprotein n=1 Tax=Slackia exigua (strain ATCC 700122 / DSM 15923 / CIP 105133 / JCM 11022 / KCTC 5966 / S-7) TaxID=649764 RepID=D0WFI8_SLAES|nr:hypothetical protein HMPREF0762_00586 [Slackia exigua ATCC 700122]EJU33775.1 putative lipoprotein [Slackia sp. CM382]